MNILFTYSFIFNPFKGGTERVTDILAKEFKRRGHNIFYLNMVKDESKMDYDFPGKVSFINEHPVDYDERAEEYITYLKDNDIDIVINQGGVMKSCNFFCETGDSKAICITTIHNTPTLNYNALFRVVSTLRDNSIKKKLRRIFRILYYPIKKYLCWKYFVTHYTELNEKCDHIVLLSDKFMYELKEIVPQINEKKVIAIGNPNTFTVKPSHSKKENLIIFVGRMDIVQKNPGVLIEIWGQVVKHFPDWHLVMIGGGEALEAMKHKAKNIPNIRFTGFTDPTPYYQKARILCMTSNFEGWGMVLTEAMSYGVVPMAFSSFASVHELLRDPIQKVTPFSKKEYIEKLSRIISDKDLRDHLQEKGYKIASDYTIEAIADVWEDYFRSLKDGYSNLSDRN